MPCRTMCTVCGFAALSHSYFIRLCCCQPLEFCRLCPYFPNNFHFTEHHNTNHEQQRLLRNAGRGEKRER
ncbi:hypothetical protein D0T90_04325 [Neisseria animalis]|uniref:Uncharacterized protein n=1 Tax=Neisseria animalis TaxID=492 RepID=A0A5P3MQH6_NEIAN|nr:hypothetical protein D0T90_04325 [Neisseria animalis]ROW31603.1 hypothetical protein CGZ60_09525 [Neisseria animalis]